jgi:hypothetical protein
VFVWFGAKVRNYVFPFKLTWTTFDAEYNVFGSIPQVIAKPHSCFAPSHYGERPKAPRFRNCLTDPVYQMAVRYPEPQVRIVGTRDGHLRYVFD